MLKSSFAGSLGEGAVVHLEAPVQRRARTHGQRLQGEGQLIRFLDRRGRVDELVAHDVFLLPGDEDLLLRIDIGELQAAFLIADAQAVADLGFVFLLRAPAELHGVVFGRRPVGGEFRLDRNLDRQPLDLHGLCGWTG